MTGSMPCTVELELDFDLYTPPTIHKHVDFRMADLELNNLKRSPSIDSMNDGMRWNSHRDNSIIEDMLPMSSELQSCVSPEPMQIEQQAHYLQQHLQHQPAAAFHSEPVVPTTQIQTQIQHQQQQPEYSQFYHHQQQQEQAPPFNLGVDLPPRFKIVDLTQPPNSRLAVRSTNGSGVVIPDHGVGAKRKWGSDALSKTLKVHIAPDLYNPSFQYSVSCRVYNSVGRQVPLHVFSGRVHHHAPNNHQPDCAKFDTRSGCQRLICAEKSGVLKREFELTFPISWDSDLIQDGFVVGTLYLPKFTIAEEGNNYHLSFDLVRYTHLGGVEPLEKFESKPFDARERLDH